MRSFTLALASPPNEPVIRKAIEAMLLAAARQPDPGSYFDKFTSDIRHLDDDRLLAALKDRGYDVVVAIENGHLAGFTAFQKHGEEWHGFVHFVPKQLEGRGIGRELVSQFLSYARAGGAKFAFLWAGDERGGLAPANRAKMEHFYAETIANNMGLSFKVKAGSRPGEVVLDG